MWKVLRNSVVAAVLVAGVLKLLLWYEVQQGAARLAAQFAPVAQVQYSSVGAGLDGIVQLDAVGVGFGKPRAADVWHAARVEIESPGPLWLARRLLLGDDSLPEHLVITIKGLQAPASALGAEASWISPISLVPFETSGCGIVSRFSVADYQRMGLNPGIQQQRIEYRYDPAGATLAFTADLSSPPFSAVSVHGDLQKFQPRKVIGSGWRELRVSEVGVTYADSGYLAKRNRFCAQQANITPQQFADQHVAAVSALLAQHGVEAGAEVATMYRSLAGEGGKISLLSLPSAGALLGQLLNQTPDVMVRQLNLTARRNDAPPVMVRLAFKAPAPEQEIAPTANTEVAATTSVVGPPQKPATAAASTTVAAAATSPAPAAAVVAATPPASKPVPLPPPTTPPPTVAAARPPPATAAAVAVPAQSSPTPAHAPVAATLPPQKATPKAVDPPADSALTSGPPPPAGSTLALVWKPSLERLPSAAPPPRDYDLIEYAALTSHTGRFIRLTTTTGKKVEGHIIGADATNLMLRVQQPGGAAELQIPRNVIVEIQLPHARASASPQGSG
jgi:hypothetical protein